MQAQFLYDSDQLQGLVNQYWEGRSMTFTFPDGETITYPPGSVKLTGVESKRVWGLKWYCGFIPWPARFFEVEYSFKCVTETQRWKDNNAKSPSCQEGP